MMPSETLISHFKPLNSSKPPHPDHSSMIYSNWLHRLRSSRGFPESDHIDLEHFLSNSREKTDSVIVRKTPPEENSVANDDNAGRDLIDNVLSDLFYMGECEDQSRIKIKKTCRKQPCPRFHAVSTNSDVSLRKDRVFSRSKLTLSGRNRVKDVDQVEEEDEKEKGRWDLSAYSQMEVTVIDTSVPCWKFDKVLYRKRHVWKVADKKGKGLMGGDRKKRKDRWNESGGDVRRKKLNLCNSSKYVDKEGSIVFSKSDQRHDQGKMVAGNEKKHDSCSQVQEKSFCKKQLAEGSSVIRIFSIPTSNKKNVSVVSNSCLKSMQR